MTEIIDLMPIVIMLSLDTIDLRHRRPRIDHFAVNSPLWQSNKGNRNTVFV